MAKFALWEWLHSETTSLVNVNKFLIFDPYLRVIDLFALCMWS